MRDMKAVVLCAGAGTRLRPLTFSRPKHLLPVAGRPLLGIALDTIIAAGIKQIALVVGHQAEAVQGFVGDGSAWGAEVSYITQEQPLGLGHAVNCAREYVGDCPFVVFLGDNLLEAGIGDFVASFRADEPEAALMVRPVDDPRQYGVAEIRADGNVERVVEKPAEPKTNLAIVGVYAFNSSIFEAIDNIQPSARGEYEITDAIQWLVDSGRPVSTTVLEGFWEDTGAPDALLRANRLYLDRQQHRIEGTINGVSEANGMLQIGTGTRVYDCRIIGPCFIGDNCVLHDAVIGPHVSLGDGCQVRNSAIEDAIIQDSCRIEDLPAGLKRSVLGEQVVVIGDAQGNSPLHLILGDMARIRVI